MDSPKFYAIQKYEQSLTNTSTIYTLQKDNLFWDEYLLYVIILELTYKKNSKISRTHWDTSPLIQN